MNLVACRASKVCMGLRDLPTTKIEYQIMVRSAQGRSSGGG